MNVSDKIRMYRTDIGYSQRELAELSGVNVLQIKRWEAGEAIPSVAALVRLSDALGVTLDGLVWADENGRQDDRWSALTRRADRLGARECARIQEVMLALVERAERRAEEEAREKAETMPGSVEKASARKRR